MAPTKNKLGKLGIAILEGFLGKHLGEGFIDELKSDFQTHDNLLRAMLETERIFRKYCEDKAFCQTILKDLPITDLKPIQEAAQSFYSNPSDPILSETLKEIFIRDLKQFVPVDIENHISLYIFVLTQQLTILDKNFSQKVNTLANLATAEAAKETLRVMKGFADDIRQISVTDDQTLLRKFEKVLNQKQEIFFSEEMSKQLASVNKIIYELTKDQFQVINWLHDKRRAAISGCAGSGKTLVAAEKAIRLAKAGMNTLILCHSPNLALYIEGLTRDSDVQVRDFTNWIKEIITPKSDLNQFVKWTYFEEPTDSELETAFDSISSMKEKYDAIIVDEGQDFRDTWWVIIEAALSSPSHGILYIFFDDNQALLPSRSKYPMETSPYSLSKNCRNAGEVFRLVSKFHPQSPAESFFLSDKGSVKYTYYQGLGIQETIEAVNNSLQFFGVNQIVILTTEAVQTSESVLNGLECTDTPRWSWQRAIENEFDHIMKSLSKQNLSSTIRNSDSLVIPRLMKRLSKSIRPLPQDIDAVIDFAKNISRQLPRDHLSFPKKGGLWLELHGELVLDIGLTYEYAYLPMSLIQQKVNFFCDRRWADEIPQPPATYTILNHEDVIGSSHFVPLYTVSAFKGLEADGIILYLNHTPSQIMSTPIPDIYVGSSRARFFLHLVIPQKILESIPYLRK